jgi:hypothetical protein
MHQITRETCRTHHRNNLFSAVIVLAFMSFQEKTGWQNAVTIQKKSPYGKYQQNVLSVELTTVRMTIQARKSQHLLLFTSYHGISSQKTWIFINQLLLVVNIETEQIPVKPRILNEAKVNILPLFHGTSPPNNKQCSLPPHISVTDVSICHNAS